MFSNSIWSIEFGKMFLSKFKYRDRATIIGNILDSIYREPRGKTKTSIMRDANLNLSQVNKYLQLLVLCDIVRAADPLNSQELTRYKLTAKGYSLLRDFEIWSLVFGAIQRGAV